MKNKITNLKTMCFGLVIAFVSIAFNNEKKPEHGNAVAD